MIKRFLKRIQLKRRMSYNKENRLKLINNDFTLISSNCVGSFIMKDLNVKYNTPTINLFFYPNDFIKFVNNIEYYMSLDLKEKIINGYEYPIGILGDIDIHFMHYESFIDAKKKWQERVKRINLNSIYIMMTDRDGCTEEIMESFNQIKYKNKVLFTNKYYEKLECSFYIKGFEDKSNVGNLFEFKNKYTVKKYYDDFDYVEWLNDTSS